MACARAGAWSWQEAEEDVLIGSSRPVLCSMTLSTARVVNKLQAGAPGVAWEDEPRVLLDGRRSRLCLPTVLGCCSPVDPSHPSA